MTFSLTSCTKDKLKILAVNLIFGRWQAKLASASLSLGLLGNICLALLFLPVARGSSLLPLFGLPSEASIKYHIWLGHTVLVFFTAHGLGYITLWAVKNQISKVRRLFFLFN